MTFAYLCGRLKTGKQMPTFLIPKIEEENSVKNHIDMLIVSQSEQVQTTICAGTSQICLMADANLRFASPRR